MYEPPLLPAVPLTGQRLGRNHPRPKGSLVPILTTSTLFPPISSNILENNSSSNNFTNNSSSHAGHVDENSPYDYQTSFILWGIICSTILAIALGSATIMYIRKATNWDYRLKLRRLIKQRKLDLIESRKVRRVRTTWQKPEEFLLAYKRREEQQQQQRQRPDGPAGLSNKQLWLEYENLRRRKLAGNFHYTSLKAFELAEKNFIKDCLPFDHNRIKLPLDPSVPCSDYINGSFVDGYSIPNFYLAIQGPFEASIVDFWRVVWLHKVRCIVMLCEPFEFSARQCFRYWPDKSMSYDDIDVKLEWIHRELDFTYRKFIVSHAASRGTLEVMHCQYKNWPQFGQPDVYTFLNFVYLIRAFNPDLKPIVVHSKTGSCRTGLFIAIDYCIESICTNNIVNVHESVRRIRRCRAGLVSAIEQYEFIYQAVRVFLLCGVTEVPIKYLGKFVHLMGQPMNNLQTNGFEQHYEILTILKRNLTQNDSATGIMSENRWVSRDATCLPPDEFRAHLITGRKGLHDYINAVICHSYLRHNAFIVTQWPILTTIKDFWRMIYDYGIISIVVLSDVSTGIRYPKFWPVKRGKRQLFDVVSVNLEAKEKRIWGTEYSYTMRQWEGFVDMKAVLMKAGEAAAAVPKGEGRTLPKWISKLFLVNGWRPNTPAADRNESIIEVLLEVEKWQKEAGPEKFICIVSTDGYQQCGVFMTLHMAHQQMLYDFKVDIMTTALAIRKTRPQLLPTKEEYDYCWRLTADLQKQIQGDAAEQSFVPGQAQIREYHSKPVPGLCTRCWFCQNRAKLATLTAPTPHKNKLLSLGHKDPTIEKDHNIEEQIEEEGEIEAQETRQLTAPLGQDVVIEAGFQPEMEPLIRRESSNVNNVDNKMTLLTVIPPENNFTQNSPGAGTVIAMEPGGTLGSRSGQRRASMLLQAVGPSSPPPVGTNNAKTSAKSRTSSQSSVFPSPLSSSLPRRSRAPMLNMTEIQPENQPPVNF